MGGDRLDAAVAAFERVHEADPAHPAASAYHERLASFVASLAPDASEALQLAARCQHLRRYAFPRDRYPEGRVGYREWREAAGRFHASEAGAMTACVVSVDGSELAAQVAHAVVVAVGPEFLAGSTRLKAGTAQKLVVNTLSTLAMVRLGKTYGNLMVDVAATNDKLRARVRRIVETATGADAADVERALEDADGEAKVAIVALLADVSAAEARGRLAASEGSIRLAMDR